MGKREKVSGFKYSAANSLHQFSRFFRLKFFKKYCLSTARTAFFAFLKQKTLPKFTINYLLLSTYKRKKHCIFSF